MKILIVFRDNQETDNLFVPILWRALKNQGLNIECSLNDFWEKDDFYDIIHFQWPEEVLGWNCQDVLKAELLQKRINFFRKNGSKFIYTRHNTCPHFSNNLALIKAYEIIEKESDLIIHMGQYSENEFNKKYPNKKNKIILHHIYENTYNESMTREEARKKLNIPIDKFVITAFGKFRNNEEVSLIYQAYKNLKLNNKFLVAPRLFPFSNHPEQSNIIKRIASYLGYHIAIPILNKYYHMLSGGNDDIVPNDELSTYMIASDIVFIQRVHILNSGNIPLAFLFKKVPVGPASGNVGEWLKETGNPTFEVKKPKSIIEALYQGIALSKAGQGEKNYLYSKENCNVKRISELYLKAYIELLTQTNNK